MNGILVNPRYQDYQQREQFTGVFQKNCFIKFHTIPKKAPVVESVLVHLWGFNLYGFT